MTTTAAPPKTPIRRRFSIDEYYRMAETGILPEEENVELLDGQIYLMSPIGSQHAACVRRLNRFFQSKIQSQALVSVQNPIRLDEISEPEPDLALLTPREDDYAARHPRPNEVFLVVEVAETSESFDRNTKLPLYARAGIPEYWVVALNDEVVHVYRDPEAEQYRTHSVCDSEDDLTVAGLSSLAPVPAATILGT